MRGGGGRLERRRRRRRRVEEPEKSKGRLRERRKDLTPIEQIQQVRVEEEWTAGRGDGDVVRLIV